MEAGIPPHSKPNDVETTNGNAELGFRRKSPPLDVRLLLYEKTLTLRKNSFTLSQIIDAIKREDNVNLSKSTISNWVNGVSSPLRAGHIFIPKPSPDLAYVIGVETGDAFLNVKLKSYQYRIRLRAVDREFVEAFNQAVSRLLGCPPHRLWKGATERETHVEFGSYLLHKFLSQDMSELRKFIEHDKACVAAFLRGFFDSEGSVGLDGHLTGSNTDLKLLRYVQYLLDKYFGIQATGPHPGKKKGTLLTRRGKSYVRNLDCFYVYVRTSDLNKFFREIGLTIKRKRVRLERKLGSQAVTMG
jgi:DNA endonuclease